jgi:prephenate dehydrogenase
MGFERIGIVGVGLLGGSVGLACRKGLSHVKIVGYSPNADERRLAEGRLAVDVAAGTVAEAVVDADLVILCTPVGAFGEMLRLIAPALKPGVVVTDVGSTKRSVVELAEKLLPAGTYFVGSHPMAGGEKHGIEHARVDLLGGALCIVTPIASTDALALQKVEQFWQSLKMRTTRLSPGDHDRWVADISHLPHAIAAALVRIQSPESLALAARGFLDTTRIAAGGAGLWTDILLDNRENLRAGIVRLQEELQVLLGHLEAGDNEKAGEWLAQAAKARSTLRKAQD